MGDSGLRDKIRGDIHAVETAALLPHHRRGALLVIAQTVDLVDVAVAIAGNETGTVSQLLASETLARPTLAQLADWCVDTDVRFQFVIIQPYVLAQLLPAN